MKYYINDQEVSFLTFRSHLHLSMEVLYGNKWIDSMKESQINFIIENMESNHTQVCINETCFLVE